MLDQADVAAVLADGESRESIIFELGFFMGRLGRPRTFLIEPRGDEIKLPHELAGVNTITYKDGDLTTAARRLAKLASDLGPNR